MLPPERLHSTMNQKSARTLLTCLNVWVSRADCRLVVVVPGCGPDHTHHLPPPTHVKFRGHPQSPSLSNWEIFQTKTLLLTTSRSPHFDLAIFAIFANVFRKISQLSMHAEYLGPWYQDKVKLKMIGNMNMRICNLISCLVTLKQH